jgi:hypothetical protein
VTSLKEPVSMKEGQEVHVWLGMYLFSLNSLSVGRKKGLC